MVSATALQAALNDSRYTDWAEAWLLTLNGSFDQRFHEDDGKAALELLWQAIKDHRSTLIGSDTGHDTLSALRQFKHRQLTRALIRQYLEDPSVFEQDLVQHNEETKTISLMDWFAHILLVVLEVNGDFTWSYSTTVTLIKVDPPNLVEPDAEVTAIGDDTSAESTAASAGTETGTGTPPAAANPEAAATDADAGTETNAPPEA